MSRTLAKRSLRLTPSIPLFLVASAVALCIPALGQIIDVPPGASLQAAIDHAPPGSVLHLPRGVIRESLTITKDITLRSDAGDPSRTILEASSPEGAVTITGTANPTVVLEGLTVRAAYGLLPDGIAVAAPARVTLRAVHVEDCLGHGVALYAESHTTLEGCTISGNRAYGVVVENSAASIGGSGNHFSGNGIDLGRYADPSIREPLAAETSEATIRVPTDVSSLQQAIDAVAPGGTVLINSGTYPEGLCIWKPVTLRGTDDGVELLPSIDGALGGAALACAGWISLESVTLRGRWESAADDVALRSVEISGLEGDAFAVLRAERALFEDSVFGDVQGIALVIGGATRARIEGCAFERSWYGIRVGGTSSLEIVGSSFERHDSVSLAFSDHSTGSLEACSLRDNAAGIHLQDTASATFRLCTFEETRGACLELADDSIGRIDNCTFAESGREALLCTDRASLSLSNSFVRDGARAGLLVRGTSVATAQSCKFSDNAGNGVRIEGSGNVSLTQCHITRNGAGSVADSFLRVGHSGAQAGLLMIDSAVAHLDRVTISDNIGAGVCITPVELAFGGMLLSYASAAFSDCALSGNGLDGIYAWTRSGIEMDRCTLSENAGCGLNIEARGQHRLSESVIEGNEGIGLSISSATVVADSVDINANTIGIMLTEDARVLLTDCSVVRNVLGILTYCKQCADEFKIPYNSDYRFTGFLSGSGNAIPGLGEPNGNPFGSVCPDDGSIDIDALVSEISDEEDEGPSD